MLAGAWARVKAYGQLPSAALHIQNRFVAYALDSAVARWGTAFDSALEEAAQGAKDAAQAERKQGQVLRRWLPSQRQYAN